MSSGLWFFISLDYGVNGVGMVDAAVLPFGFFGQDTQAWGFHFLNSFDYNI